MKKMRLSELLIKNHFIDGEEQAALKQMMELFIEKHCKAGSKVERDLKDLTQLLINPWVNVHLEQLTHATYHICLTENGLEYEKGVETKDIQLLKQNLLDYWVEIKEEIPPRERWDLFAELIQEARKEEAYKEDIQAIRFTKGSKKSKNLHASEVFKIETKSLSFYAILESLGEVEGKRRYNLYFLDPKRNNPMNLYACEKYSSFFIKEPDVIHTFEKRDNEGPQETVARLIEVMNG